MSPATSAFDWLLARLARASQNEALVTTSATIVITLIVTLAIEVRRGRSWRDLGLRSLVTDGLYVAVYVGGVYALLVSGPIDRGLGALVDGFAPWLRLDLSTVLPAALHVAVFYLVIDLVGYWVHRLQHASRLLWSFHEIHHSQERLSVLTNFRFHFVDTLVAGLARFVPALLITPREFWIPAGTAVLVFQLLAHSGRDWSLGPLGRVLVSPRFHGVHHSRAPVHLDRNFGMIFSFWDRLFGTEYRGSQAVESFGTTGGVPESFLRQLTWPFQHLGLGWRRDRAAA